VTHASFYIFILIYDVSNSRLPSRPELTYVAFIIPFRVRSSFPHPIPVLTLTVTTMRFLPLLLAPLLSVLALPNILNPSPYINKRDIISQLTHLIQFIDVFITTETLEDSQVSLDFQVQNPTIFDLKVVSISTTASRNGTTLARFTHNFNNFVVPALGSANSGSISNVTLTQGIIASLPFVSDPFLDTQSILNIIAGIIPIPVLPYNQNSVTTNYNIVG